VHVDKRNYDEKKIYIEYASGSDYNAYRLKTLRF
jgi:hypothetical protein